VWADCRAEARRTGDGGKGAATPSRASCLTRAASGTGRPRSSTASSPWRPARKIAAAHAAGKWSPGLGSGRGRVADGSRAGRWVAGWSRPVTPLIHLWFRTSSWGRVAAGYSAPRPENRRKHRAHAHCHFGSSVYGKSHSLAHREKFKIEEEGWNAIAFAH
jgi:hypothetical protein